MENDEPSVYLHNGFHLLRGQGGSLGLMGPTIFEKCKNYVLMITIESLGLVGSLAITLLTTFGSTHKQNPLLNALAVNVVYCTSISGGIVDVRGTLIFVLLSIRLNLMSTDQCPQIKVKWTILLL